MAPQARVVRDGAERMLHLNDVVDGDLVTLRSGDQVVADGDVARSVGLMLDESPLTGESLPVARAEGERVLSGSFCVEGSGGYVVTGTGPESYAWQLLGTAREDTAQRSPLEQQVNQLLRLLVAVMVPLGAALVWTLAARDTPFREAVATATAGIVTMIPEGLVLLMSLTFAVGAVRLSRKGMLVQYMNAIESLANVDTVCLDKTGTLTDGNLVLYSVAPLGGAAEDDVRTLVSGYAASAEARNSTLDAVAAGLPGAAAATLEEVPFSSRWKWSGIRREDGWLVLGAPDVLLAGRLPAEVVGTRAGGPPGAGLRAGRAGRVPGRRRWRYAPDRAAGAGRAGGAAARRRRRHHRLPLPSGRRREGDVGRLAGDGGGRRRPRRHPRVRHAQAGLRPARGPGPAGGRGARGDGVRAAHPDHKRALIAALTGHGAYVAMIGDGVNDVPAMKGARLAVALGSGTQLAKSVADSVLVTDRFGAIPDAVGEGRKIINNVQRVAKLFVTKSVFAAFVIATFGLWTAEFPLLPRHLSLAATFTVGVPGFLLALGPGGPTTEQGSFLRRVLRFALPAGAVLGAATLTAYLAVADVHGRRPARRAAPPPSRCSCSSASTCCWCSRPSACRPAGATRPRWWRWPPAWAAASWRCSARRACASSSPWPFQVCGR